MVSQLSLRTAKKTMSKTHKNAVLKPTDRFEMVDENTLVKIAIWFNVTTKIVRKWVNLLAKQDVAVPR